MTLSQLFEKLEMFVDRVVYMVTDKMGRPHECDEWFGLFTYPNDPFFEVIHELSVE